MKLFEYFIVRNDGKEWGTLYYPSKRDVWMTLVLWAAFFLMTIPPVFFPDLGVWMVPDFLDKQWIRVVILFTLACFIISFWFKTGYTIEEGNLKIQYGPFKKNIPIHEIKNIRETKNLFADPALSMDKLEIYYAKYDTIAISPKNKSEFIEQMLQQNPNIKIKQ